MGESGALSEIMTLLPLRGFCWRSCTLQTVVSSGDPSLCILIDQCIYSFCFLFFFSFAEEELIIPDPTKGKRALAAILRLKNKRGYVPFSYGKMISLMR